MRSLGCLFGTTLLIAAAAASGCATQSQVVTSDYALTVPSYWKVERAAKQPGEGTKVLIVPYGDAVIDQGPGAQAGNYDVRTADVEVWIYAWPAQSGDEAAGTAAEQVFRLLAPMPELSLSGLSRVPEQPPECDRFPRGYTVAGQTTQPLDLIRRPGHRVIVVGARVQERLLGVLARVEFEQDLARYCHNLRNMQVQLQNLLDGMQVGDTPRAGVRRVSP